MESKTKGEANRDLLKEWLELGREILDHYYPGATHAALYIFHKDETPPARFTLPASVSSAPLPERPASPLLP